MGAPGGDGHAAGPVASSGPDGDDWESLWTDLETATAPAGQPEPSEAPVPAQPVDRDGPVQAPDTGDSVATVDDEDWDALWDTPVQDEQGPGTPPQDVQATGEQADEAEPGTPTPVTPGGQDADQWDWGADGGPVDDTGAIRGDGLADDDIAGPDDTPWDEPPTVGTDGVAAAPASAMPGHPRGPASDGDEPLPADDDDWIAQIGSRGVSLDLDWDDDEDDGESTALIGDTGAAGADAVDVAACADDDGSGRARSYRPLIIAAAVFVAILMVAALVFAVHAHQTAGEGRRREAQCAQYAQQLAQWDASVARAKRLRLNAGSSPERTCPADTEAHTSRLRSRTNSLDKRISEQIATQWEAMRTQAAQAVKDWPLAGKDTLSALKGYDGLPVGTLDALQSRQDTLRGLRAKAQQEDAANRAKQEAERKKQEEERKKKEAEAKRKAEEERRRQEAAAAANQPSAGL